MQNSVISIRITSLYGSRPSSVDFDCKTESFGTELSVSVRPRPHLSLCASKTSWVAPELQVSVGPSRHLCLFHIKQRILGQHTSLYEFQTSPVVLWMQNSAICTWNTGLYGSQPSSAVFASKTVPFGPELQDSMGTRPHLPVCTCKQHD